MANRAMGVPRLTGPQPVPEQAVAVHTATHSQALIHAGDSRRADAAFFYAMLACGCSVLALVGLIVYELITKSSLSWHAFGWKFFFQSDWDPVNDQFGALPFVYGTSFLLFWRCSSLFPSRSGLLSISPKWRRAGCAEPWPSPRNCWLPFPASFMDCGRFSSWCRCSANTCSPGWQNTWAGRACLKDRPTVSACWRLESF